MAKKNKKNTLKEIDYNTEATPRTLTPDGIPVFCAHDKIIPVEKAIPNPKNPNQHNTDQIALLGNIIQANGWRAAITISKRSGFIVKGHGRRLAALHIESGFVPVDYQEYASEAEEWADLIADNRLAELATMDTAMLVDLINEMDTGEIPIEMTGYTSEDLATIIAALEGADDTVNDKADAVPEAQNVPMSKAGDIWSLGAHKLICGSAIDRMTIAKLMGGEKAQLINTDPPYGVGFTGSSRDRNAWKMIDGDDLSHDDLMAGLLIPAFKNYVEFSDPDAAFYIWHASSTRRDFEDAMTAAGLLEKQYIIWIKNNFVIGRGDYHWMHEPCFYAEKAGQSANFYGDRSQITAWKVVLRGADQMATVLTGGVVLTDGAGGKVFLNDKPPKGKKIRYIRLKDGKSVCLYPESKASTVWEVAKETGAEHPTQKPVELAVRAIENSSKPGDLVIDFFGRSGSTLIGAEMTGRRCNIVELDPRYCDVIINRYVRFTGNIGVTCKRGDKEIPYIQLKTENDKQNGIMPEQG